MEEQLVSFQTAKLAKEKGFNWKCNSVYDDSLEHKFEVPRFSRLVNWNSYTDEGDGLLYSAPTQSLLQKYLREVHGIHIKVGVQDADREREFIYEYVIVTAIDEVRYIGYRSNFSNYEEALETALQEALNSIK